MENLGSGGSDYDLTIYHGAWVDANSLSNGICQLAAYGSTFHAYHTGEFAIENYREAYSGDDNAATVETRGTYGFDGWAESAAVEGVPKDRPLKVLMIGNSFSLSNFRQMPKVVARCRRM